MSNQNLPIINPISVYDNFPKELAVEVIWQAVVDYLLVHEGSLRKVRFCNIDALTTGLFFKQALWYAEQHQLEVTSTVVV